MTQCNYCHREVKEENSEAIAHDGEKYFHLNKEDVKNYEGTIQYISGPDCIKNFVNELNG